MTMKGTVRPPYAMAGRRRRKAARPDAVPSSRPAAAPRPAASANQHPPRHRSPAGRSAPGSATGAGAWPRPPRSAPGEPAERRPGPAAASRPEPGATGEGGAGERNELPGSERSSLGGQGWFWEKRGGCCGGARLTPAENGDSEPRGLSVHRLKGKKNPVKVRVCPRDLRWVKPGNCLKEQSCTARLCSSDCLLSLRTGGSGISVLSRPSKGRSPSQ